MNTIKDILWAEAQAIINIPEVGNKHWEGALHDIRQTIENRHKIITSGIGKAGQIAMNIATTLCSIGVPAVFLHPAEAQHGDLGVIQPGDTLLCISNSGETREVIELVDLACKLYGEFAKPTVIVITAHKNSPLAKKADCVLPTGNPPEVCILGLTPTTSTTVMTVMGDILVVMLQEVLEFNKEDYAKRHHGGYLGEKSRT